ncbi:metal-sensitive transcriptional regulator [Luteococcus sediminum]|uniref:metal-sensitive transcriptional regulator n=1 Tax=Luteococcus sp. TaxID=1969402 RepID=UPI002649D478|nr:metal-sensitive transcriptional regulator [Luteococcus sp.]MDN5563725.1 metal-sensitive transcriptional regulator [Luteococcus sp.]
MEMDPQEMRPVVNRLKRARGQLDLVIRQIEEGQECSTAVHSLATVSGALDRAGFAIIFTTMKRIQRDPDHEVSDEEYEELQKLFLSLS